MLNNAWIYRRKAVDLYSILWDTMVQEEIEKIEIAALSDLFSSSLFCKSFDFLIEKKIWKKKKKIWICRRKVLILNSVLRRSREREEIEKIEIRDLANCFQKGSFGV